MLCRVFQNIDNEKMAAHRSASADVLRKEISASATYIICIDGKAMRGALYDNGRNPDIVSAYSLRSGFILATDVCKEKSNEIIRAPVIGQTRRVRMYSHGRCHIIPKGNNRIDKN